MAHTIVIFGASGDLTSRKLIPALYSLYKKKRLPQDFRVVGVSRKPFDHAGWRGSLLESTVKFTESGFDHAVWDEFSQRLFYVPGDIGKLQDFQVLSEFLATVEPESGADRVYYLSTMPQLYAEAIEKLGASGLANGGNGQRRVIIEKPFGTDLQTARKLNAQVHKVFSEEQVYRIDHYLGKETVQNLFAMRFGNSIFEPLWNRNYINHVQITVAEEVLIGSRADYYDKSGILRDMFQNHILQLLMLTAMEPPPRFDASMIRDEKVQVLHSVRPMSGGDFAAQTVRGRYQGYLKESGVPPDSQTETFAILKLYVDNWRWKDVPFYLRSGKGMSCRSSQIVIQFKSPPHLLFGKKVRDFDANRLVIQIQPAEGIQLHIQSKVPDTEMKTRTSTLEFRFDGVDSGAMPDGYQRLLLDAINGDASLFARSDEVELSWGIIDPILGAWRSPAAPPLLDYEPGMWGPPEAVEWMREQHREWFDVCPVL
jgi:glucose-6-phosphate 1-dehydrogenase